MQLTARRAAALAALLVVVTAPPARADETSGTWTGALELQANYYWETSTRVVAPSVRARLTSPEGTDLHVEYLVDAITSASVASGLQTDRRFTEVRNQVTGGFGRELDLGDAQLRLDLSGRVSHEPDYLATGLTLSSALSMAQRCTTFGASLTYIHDDVGSVIRGETATPLSDRGRVGQLEGVALGLSFAQVLTEWAVASVGYDVVHNWGFLANPYRAVVVAGAARPEDHPDQRTRNSFHGRLALFVPPTRSAVHLMYRVYFDEWSVAAITPEVRFYQELGDALTVRLRYRYYAQTRSFFYALPEMYGPDAEFVTADPKMSEFDSHLFGVHARLELDFLAGSFLDFLSRGQFWMSFDYWLQTSRFGDGVIAQSAFSVPF